MTIENQLPVLTGPSDQTHGGDPNHGGSANHGGDPRPETRDNILLNWIVVLAGLGAISLIAFVLTELL